MSRMRRRSHPKRLEQLRGANTLVLNALFRTEHPTHLSIPEAIATARLIGAEQNVFDASDAR